MNNNSLILERFRLSVIIRIFIMLGALVIVFGFSIHFLEPKVFPSIFDGIWWAIVTVFTVGYGDYVPQSTYARLLGILLILLGTGFGSYYMVSFTTELISRQYSNQKGQAAVSLNRHLIVVGWNERAKRVVSQYKVLYPHKDIVLIDETLPTLPSDYSHLYFVKGCSHHDKIMLRADSKHADTILITADKEKSEGDADVHSVLTVLTVKGMNPNIYCIVEMLTSHQIENAKRAGADEIVQANKLTSYVMTASMTLPSSSETIISLCKLFTANKIQLIPFLEKDDQSLFRIYGEQLLKKDMLLLGVQRNGENIIHPSHPFLLQTGDIFIVIKT
ncbi:ion channel [Ectobacillus polymachus]|uniref:ion channel n=1 Tax=Ectobacillus polymachus TaxID=1508806 RepID=UPI003A89D8FE